MTENIPPNIEFKTPLANRTVSALKATPSGVARAVDSPFTIPPSPLMKRLGCGTFVTVYRYKRPKTHGIPSSPWAIKKAKKGRARRSIINRLTSEGKVLRELSHPNIVAFKKLTHTAEGDVCLSMEDCGKGLDDVICTRRDDNDDTFTATEIMKVTWSIAKALKYLHTIKKLLHGDIKSGNVLIRGNFEQVKLCDFGVSIYLKDDLTGPREASSRYVGSEPWYSPELLSDDIITDKADIFAYGLVIWEMLALDVPHVYLMKSNDESSLDGSFETDDDSFTIPREYYDALGTRPPLPDTEYDKSYDPVIGTFVCCTTENYLKRPSAASVVDSLSGVIGDFGIAE